MATPTARMRSTIWFAAYAATCLLVFWVPLRSLAQLALSSDTYSHILIIPFISIFLVFIERERLFRTLGRSVSPAAVLFVAGVLLGVLGWKAGAFFSGSNSLELVILGFLCLIWAGFLFFYGTRAFAAGIFPLLFLLLMVPVPSFLLDRFIVWLQIGSADVAEWFFHLSGTPVLREGLIFVLPQVSIEVAKECSGIRSTQALLITCLLAGHLFLRTNWRRTALLIAAVPVLIIKNGVRIATLTLLAVHVDPSFLSGRLHRDGGFLFFILGMLILLPLFLWFQRSETALLGRNNFPGPSASPDNPQA
ncbi:MAG TPA: exosortase/archaeosortase family protein [Acidobacteriaceae bacterium]|nr:exosortase/archaeosortase family protein [Acidobacteriaceae bacterium]